MVNSAYVPPLPKFMSAAQNSEQAIRVLLAQRLLYSKAKRFLLVRIVGMFVIALVAPVIGAIWPDLAVACGAVAGGWIFLSRTWITNKQKMYIDEAAATQEQFDATVFGMPPRFDREHAPSLEDVEKLTGTRKELSQGARLEKLKNWYHFEDSAEPAIAVATAQRANVSYSDSLLKTTAKIWRVAVITWAVIALIGAFVLGVEVQTFVLIVVLPLLPAVLDLIDFGRDYDKASYVRAATAREIERAVEGSGAITAQHLLVWQERMYELRRTTPLVPDAVYWLARKSNESAMVRVARRLTK